MMTVSPAEQANYERLLAALDAVREDMLKLRAEMTSVVSVIHPTYRLSALNLLHYLALRRRDLRLLQTDLAKLGLSSLGRAEAHTLATVDAVRHMLSLLAGGPRLPAGHDHEAPDFESGRRLLAEHAHALLGAPPALRDVRIMVTMPSEAAHNDTLVHDLVKQGMDCMRINCAHDDAAAWGSMIEHLRHAEQALGISCRILMDLGGPKLRTGPIEPGPAVMKIRPQRDVYGRVTAPARVWLYAQETPRPALFPATASIPVAQAGLSSLASGDHLDVSDARGARRTMHVIDVTDDGAWAELRQTTYLLPGTRVSRRTTQAGAGTDTFAVGAFPARENAILLRVGDLLMLTRSMEPGRPATYDRRGQVLSPAAIGCTLPHVFEDVGAGQSIWLDDGKIGGVIERVEPEGLHIRVTDAGEGGAKLRSDKGINLPDSVLRLPALSAKDIEDLAFVAQHADMVALSFSNSADDVHMLVEQIRKLGSQQPAIVLKIETRRGFENLAAMLLAAMQTPCCGVMIARGDLAVECGYERLAEVQEEILWVCEAAHVPVIWATQVLESLAKEGIPSRAEITDAAMGHRAECVMLNKGPHIIRAVRVLDDILRRMQAHQNKKQSMLRELGVAHSFLG